MSGASRDAYFYKKTVVLDKGRIDRVGQAIKDARMNRALMVFLTFGAAVAAMTGGAGAAEPAMVMLRFSSAQTQSLEEWRQTAKALAANRGCCDDVWFSTGESFPGMDWHRKNLEVVRVAAEDLRKIGIRVSLQFEATIGHGDDFPTAEEKARFDKPWTGWTGPDGTECRYCSCPRQTGFLKRLAEVSELYAVIRPEIVWIDDDLRLENHWPVTGREGPGCWCDRCVADFSKLEGRTWTRPELHRAWKTDAALQDRWGDFSAGSMAEVARVIACAFRKVSPKTRLGLQTSENRKLLLGAVARKLKQATGEKTAVRLGGGDYYDLSPYVQLRKSWRMVRARKELDMEDLVDNWCTEVESYPRAYGSRSVRSIALEAFSSVAWGFDTTSLFVMDRRSETDELYSRYLLKPLVTVTKFLNDYRAANAGTVPAGFTCPDADPERILMGLPILPGLGKSWGTVSGQQESSLGWGPVWGEFRNDLMTDFRRMPSAKLQSVRDRVSGNAPLKLLSPFGGLVLPRVAADGELRTVGLIGTRLDPQEAIAIQLQTAAEKAVWCELGAEPVELRVQATGDRREVTVPSIGAWGMGYLVIR